MRSKAPKSRTSSTVTHLLRQLPISVNIKSHRHLDSPLQPFPYAWDKETTAHAGIKAQASSGAQRLHQLPQCEIECVPPRHRRKTRLTCSHECCGSHPICTRCEARGSACSYDVTEGLTKRQQQRLDLSAQVDKLERAMTLLNYLRRGSDEEGMPNLHSQHLLRFSLQCNGIS